MKELEIEAKRENLPLVLSLVDGMLEEADCSFKTQVQVDVAVEEIFVNIADYAYSPGTGMARIRAQILENPLSLEVSFVDQGVPYNPLEKEDPDVTLSAEERKIGGLGIYLVKKSMSEIKYEYKDEQNILTIRKLL